jgi:hypothetical protein
MNNSVWDSYGDSSEKKVMPIWGKLLLGCGIAMLLALAGCAGFVYWASHSGKDAFLGYVSDIVSSKLEEPWSQLIGVAEAIKTDEGAAILYRNNPGLSSDYPSEAEFIKQATLWRARLGELPSHPPALEKLRDGNLHVNINRPNKRKALEIRYTTPDRVAIGLRWEEKKLVEIDIR